MAPLSPAGLREALASLARWDRSSFLLDGIMRGESRPPWCLWPRGGEAEEKETHLYLSRCTQGWIACLQLEVQLTLKGDLRGTESHPFRAADVGPCFPWWHKSPAGSGHQHVCSSERRGSPSICLLPSLPSSPLPQLCPLCLNSCEFLAFLPVIHLLHPIPFPTKICSFLIKFPPPLHVFLNYCFFIFHIII